MNNKFDELAKGLAQSVTRRGALKKLGVGLAGIALASLGLTNKAEARKPGCLPYYTYCVSAGKCKSHCCSGQGFFEITLDGRGVWLCV